MKILKIALTAALMTGFASAATAQDSGVYVNLGIDAFEFDAYTIGGKVGYEFNEYFGVEGQGSFGISGDTTAGIETDIDFNLGAFGIARYPLFEKFEVFGRAGYHVTEVSQEFGTLDASFTLDGFAVGGGGQFFFTPNDGIRAEYTYLDASDGASADVFSLSYVRKF